MFCRTCGVHLFTDLAVTEEEFQSLSPEVRKDNEQRKNVRPVNVRVFNGFDLLGVRAIRVDGWGTLKPEYVNP